MTDPDRQAQAGRPRSDEAHRAILEATLELLAEASFSDLTVEGVATRAGVGKATIYRRWPSKLHMVVEAFSELPGLEEVDSGSVAQDLEEMLRSYLQTLNSTPLARVMPSLAGERAHNSDLSELLDPLLRGRRQPILAALARGVERGEIRDDVDLELAADLIFGPIAMRVFFSGTRINPRIVHPTIEAILRGLAPRVGAGRT